MKQPLLLGALLFFLSRAASAQCPESVTYGDAAWPNKITLTSADGSMERVFYFKEMVAIAGEGRFWLKSPTFQGNLGEEGDLPGNALSVMYFADEAEPDYTLSISNFKLESGTIDCFEMPEKFGGSGVRYTRELTPGNYRTDAAGRAIMSVAFDVRSRRDESFAAAELNMVYLVPLRIPEPPEDVVLRTSPDTLRGHITYNTVYNADTRDRPGLTVVLAADTLHRFSLHEFEGKPGVFQFADQLFEISVFDEDRIVLDRYAVDRERVMEITAQTFFDFNLASTLTEAFPEGERKHLYRLEGPYRLYGGAEAAQPEDLLSGYRYDMHDAVTKGGGYRFFTQPQSEQPLLSGKPLVRFDPAYRTELLRTDKQFEYIETLNADAEGHVLTAGMVSLSRKKKKGDSGPTLETAALDAAGYLRQRSLSERRSDFTAEIRHLGDGTVRITAENEAQGRQSTLWNPGDTVPDILQMNLLLSTVAWEEGMALEMEFRDHNFLQTFSNSTGPMGRVSYSKRSVAPVRAMIKAEALAAEEIKGRPARKVAVYSKDFGRGTPLLRMLSRSVPFPEPYQLFGYFWFAADSPGILQIADAEGQIVFGTK